MLIRIITVNATILRHFTHKASVTSVHAEANAHSADWLTSVFVNELAPPYVRSQQGQCEQQCRRILANTVHVCNIRHDDMPCMHVIVCMLKLPGPIFQNLVLYFI